MADSLVANRFRTHRRLGSGSFGEIFVGVDQTTNSKVAMKFERQNLRCPQLRHEFKVYRELKGCKGVCNVSHYGTHGTYNVMVLELLGPSLEELFTRCGRKFSLKTTLKLADQILERVETLHSRHLIHRDIKPANFVAGDATSPMVFCIDFGLSKRFRNPHTFQHISYRTGKSLTGTPRYASISNHQGVEQSRRDDLEAVGYVLVYFLRGRLPWQGLKAKSAHRKYKLILEKKQEISIAQLCGGCPPEFSEYLSYCRCLGFEKDPDMSYLRGLFRHLYKAQGYDLNQLHAANNWDWIAPSQQRLVVPAAAAPVAAPVASAAAPVAAPAPAPAPVKEATGRNGAFPNNKEATAAPYGSNSGPPGGAVPRTTTTGAYATTFRQSANTTAVAVSASNAMHTQAKASSAARPSAKRAVPESFGQGSERGARRPTPDVIRRQETTTTGTGGPSVGRSMRASSLPRGQGTQQPPQPPQPPRDPDPALSRAASAASASAYAVAGASTGAGVGNPTLRQSPQSQQKSPTRDPFTRSGADRYELRRPRSAINYRDSTAMNVNYTYVDPPRREKVPRATSSRSATRTNNNNARPAAAPAPAAGVAQRASGGGPRAAATTNNNFPARTTRRTNAASG